MYTVLLVLHIMVTILLIGIILIQRSDTDGLSGLGGGSSGGGFMSGRAKANLITRGTSILAIIFMCTSLGMGILIAQGRSHGSIAERIAAGETAPVPAAAAGSPATPTPAETPKAAVPADAKDLPKKTTPSVPKPE